MPSTRVHIQNERIGNTGSTASIWGVGAAQNHHPAILQSDCGKPPACGTRQIRQPLHQQSVTAQGNSFNCIGVTGFSPFSVDNAPHSYNRLIGQHQQMRSPTAHLQDTTNHLVLWRNKRDMSCRVDAPQKQEPLFGGRHHICTDPFWKREHSHLAYRSVPSLEASHPFLLTGILCNQEKVAAIFRLNEITLGQKEWFTFPCWGSGEKNRRRQEIPRHQQAEEYRRFQKMLFSGKRFRVYSKDPQCFPVLPNPPAPRSLPANSSTMLNWACTTGTTTSWAMRSMGLMVKAAWPRFQQETKSWPW